MIAFPDSVHSQKEWGGKKGRKGGRKADNLRGNGHASSFQGLLLILWWCHRSFQDREEGKKEKEGDDYVRHPTWPPSFAACLPQRGEGKGKGKKKEGRERNIYNCSTFHCSGGRREIVHRFEGSEGKQGKGEKGGGKKRNRKENRSSQYSLFRVVPVPNYRN